MKKWLSLFLTLMMILGLLAGCSGGGGSSNLDEAGATKELASFIKDIKPVELDPPTPDIYMGEPKTSDALADISTFPIMVEGNGEINIEIAAATEMSATGNDDWINVMAQRFNAAGFVVDGKTATASIRKIASGEIVTYMVDGEYRPDVVAPSYDAWGEMLRANGFNVVTLSDRILGNTAGILMEKKTHDTFVEKYKEVTVKTVIEACLAGDLQFAYTNPYTSSTGLNIFTAMLAAFDPDNPLSSEASQKLLDYQKKSPPVAYTTAVLRDSAAKGIINAMVMEQQAYINTPELSGYIFTPAGVRHDHPVYTFDYVSAEKQAVAELFVEFCLSEESQKLGTEKGFNRDDSYESRDSGLSGAGLLAAQKLWKQNKDGGQPIIAVFVADTSGSMEGLPMNSLKSSLISSMGFIGEEHYVGLVSYSDADKVYINLPIGQFDATQRSLFSGAVKSLSAGGGTATYNGVLTALNLLLEKEKEVPNAKLLMFVLSDGQQNTGYALSRVTPIVRALGVPVYTIGYNLNTGAGATVEEKKAVEELTELAKINEAAILNAISEELVNHLRNLFNVAL